MSLNVKKYVTHVSHDAYLIIIVNGYTYCSEEAKELMQILLRNEDKSRSTSKIGDLMYHAMVLLRVKGFKSEEVLEPSRKWFAIGSRREKSCKNKSECERVLKK